MATKTLKEKTLAECVNVLIDTPTLALIEVKDTLTDIDKMCCKCLDLNTVYFRFIAVQKGESYGKPTYKFEFQIIRNDNDIFTYSWDNNSNDCVGYMTLYKKRECMELVKNFIGKK